MSEQIDKAADALRREGLAKDYPQEVIAPWARLPEPVKDEYRAKVNNA